MRRFLLILLAGFYSLPLFSQSLPPVGAGVIFGSGPAFHHFQEDFILTKCDCITDIRQISLLGWGGHIEFEFTENFSLDIRLMSTSEQLEFSDEQEYFILSDGNKQEVKGTIYRRMTIDMDYLSLDYLLSFGTIADIELIFGGNAVFFDNIIFDDRYTFMPRDGYQERPDLEEQLSSEGGVEDTRSTALYAAVGLKYDIDVPFAEMISFTPELIYYHYLNHIIKNTWKSSRLTLFIKLSYKF